MIALRPDIALRRAGKEWLLFDPLRHRYFKADPQDVRGLAEGRSSDRTRTFLNISELLADCSSEHSRTLAARAAKGRHVWWEALLHRYLFVRIPLVRPDAWLDATLPIVRLATGRAALVVLACLAALAAVLVMRRSDEFGAAFAQLATWQSAFASLIALACLKTAHELGHAYALKRYGGRVPSIGIAFVVLFPILYTDTSDAWLLGDRRKRLAVDLAGVATELAIAVLATWAWLFMPDGAARGTMFMLAAISWTLSLAVNLNPFMRFDGYHVLADSLDVPNLQERSFALTRWRLREALFATGTSPPESFAPSRRRLLVAYAWLTWCYRLVLFTGIALLVYHATFKLLGIFLFAFEIWWFILRPILREMRTWPVLFDRRTLRSWLPIAGIASVLILLALPIDDTVHLPAVLANGRVTVLRSADAGIVRVLRETDGQVARGEVVARLRQPLARYEHARLAARRAAAKARSVHSEEGRQRRTRTAGELGLVATARSAATKRDLRGTVVAPADGVLRLERGFRHGSHLGAGMPLATLISKGRHVVALADEGALQRIGRPSAGTFLPDAGGDVIEVTLTRRSHFPEPALRQPELDRVHGGAVATVRPEGGERDRRPLRPQFALRFDAGRTALPPGRWRGVVRLDVEGRSYGAAMVRRIRSVLIRESGF